MFKLKAGNVFQKMNTMDKKQAYTWGGIAVVCLISLITLASFLGDAEDTSFEGFNTRGYDLAQMPFVNDEAEEYLLSSKYPDMQNNGSTMLYSQEEKEARQEADAAAEADAEESADSDSSYSSDSDSSGGYSSRGYSGRGRGAGGGAPTQVGQLGSASMGRAGGSGMSGTFGAPRGDFSPYKSQEKGSEIQYQLKNTDARKALSQFAQTSRAAAGLKDNRNANAKRALMGGSIKGSEAFTDSGVDMSKASGLNLDTNAPTSSADLSNLDKKVGDAAKKAQDKNDQDKQDLSDKLLEQFLTGLVNLGMQALGGLVDKGLNAAFGAIDAYGAKNAQNGKFQDTLNQLTPKDVEPNSPMESTMKAYLGEDAYASWKKDGKVNAGDYISTNNVDVKHNMKTNAGKIFYPSRNETDNTWQMGASLAVSRSNAGRERMAAAMGRPSIIDNSSLTKNNNTNTGMTNNCPSGKKMVAKTGGGYECQ